MNGKTTVLLLSPEIGRLPQDMGTLARFISGKSGGMGEVVAALCEGLRERGIDFHLGTLNLKKRFKEECGLNEEQWRDIRYKIDPDRIHLVNASFIANLMSAYSGNPLLNAATFQKQMVQHFIKTIRAKSGGKLIIHSHDWMAGGAITAYAKATGCPVLHTIHNVHTGHIPLDMLFGVDIDLLRDFFYMSNEHGQQTIDCQATAIKNASLINFVGVQFMYEILEDYFLDRTVLSPAVRQEIKVKYNHGATLAILNAPSRLMYPEVCPFLVRNYGPDDDVFAAKRKNLVAFQQRTGLIVNPEAILFYWPSRLDPSQKGVELLEDVALRFVIENGDAQIAIVGDGVGRDRTHEAILGRIAMASGGKIAYHHFEESLSMLGYAAANDVFGASLYEPCGQIDQIGNLFGATATNRDTGGYHDKIHELRLDSEESDLGAGNGFLFRDYDSGGLSHALSKSIRFHRHPARLRERHIKHIMRETRNLYDLSKMIGEYVAVYERLNGNKSLA
ncbi:MAG: glycogen/starch synthase [Syntrophales bacterium]|jgi:glycogen synthase|nr:glycogen/starch synthase [Syntrophales bacterium]